MIRNIQEELDKYLHIRNILIRRIDNSVKGSLRVSTNTSGYSYYLYISKSEQKYISKSDHKTIKLLAQKAYDEKVLKVVNSRIKILHKLLDHYKKNQIHLFHRRVSRGRQNFITPIELTFEEKVSKWKNQEEKTKLIEKNAVIHHTKNEELVRSKSEKTIADALFYSGVPYKYETLLKLGNINLYPDFTILSPTSQRLIYWEHCGMMDNSDYLEYFMRKINTYICNGLIPGRDVILTYESKNMPLNFKIVEKLIEEYF